MSDLIRDCWKCGVKYLRRPHTTSTEFVKTYDLWCVTCINASKDKCPTQKIYTTGEFTSNKGEKLAKSMYDLIDEDIIERPLLGTREERP